MIWSSDSEQVYLYSMENEEFELNIVQKIDLKMCPKWTQWRVEVN